MSDLDWEEFVSEAERVISTLDELPDRASDFADGVRERLEGMVEWAREHERVTERMVKALDNMASGVARWLT